MLSQEETTAYDSVVIADGDHLGHVAFMLTCHFERVLERRVPEADLTGWTECALLDGGTEPGEGSHLLVLIHDAESTELRQFRPALYDGLDAKAFRGALGETAVTVMATTPQADKATLMQEAISAIAGKAPRRLVVVPNDEEAYIYNKVSATLRALPRTLLDHTTLLTMQPPADMPCRHVLLGYSLMAALGIKSEEL